MSRFMGEFPSNQRRKRGRKMQNDWSVELNRELERLVEEGHTTSAIAKKLGRKILAIEWQLTALGLTTVEDAKGAECLKDNKPMRRVYDIFRNRLRRDPKLGYMVIDEETNEYRVTTVQQLCDLAGIERPYS